MKLKENIKSMFYAIQIMKYYSSSNFSEEEQERFKNDFKIEISTFQQGKEKILAEKKEKQDKINKKNRQKKTGKKTAKKE